MSADDAGLIETASNEGSEFWSARLSIGLDAEVCAQTIRMPAGSSKNPATIVELILDKSAFLKPIAVTDCRFMVAIVHPRRRTLINAHNQSWLIRT